MCCCFFFSSRRRHTRWPRDWSSDVCSSDLVGKIGMLRDYGFLGRIVAQDLEPEWVQQATDYDPYIEIKVCDAAAMEWAEDEIGRASCREREERSVDAVAVGELEG